MIKKTLKKHSRIIFNGNGYSRQWEVEANARGLSNHKSTAKALSHFLSEKNLELVTKRGIFSESEFRARHEIHLEAYNKMINIEARTTVDMVMHQILPAAMQYSSDLADSVNRKRIAADLPATAESALLKRLSGVCDSLYEKTEKLTADIKNVPADSEKASHYYCNVIVPQMQAVREDADILESITAKSYWPYPTYSDMLFY